MKIQAVRLAYFSPTKTTKMILKNIAEGIRVDIVKHIDVTLPDGDRYDFSEMKEDELLVVGAPVYAGRVPEIAVQRFQRLKSTGSPAVIVVLYGNREFEDALLELSDIAVSAGFIPVAGGAFVGEHSFSTESVPLAAGRPDAADIWHARKFGASIGKYLHDMYDLRDIPLLKLPGNRPFREHGILPKISPVTENDRCAACEACASVCPSGSITIDETSKTNVETCILCCACVKECPGNARVIKDPMVKKIIEWLRTNAAKRKEPEMFLCDT